MAITHDNSIEQMVPNDVVKMFTMIYSNEKMFNKQASCMLWGQPGVGKSQLVQQFAHELSRATGKKVNLKIVSLMLMTPPDMMGLPAKGTDPVTGEPTAQYTRPEMFQLDHSPDVYNILFLDELTQALPSIQACAYQICLDHRVGPHVLPDNTLVIAAGNRITDKSVAYTMPAALKNRFRHFEIVSSLDDWKIWAYRNDIDNRIIGYLSNNPEDLNRFDPDLDGVAFATPRSWEHVSNTLKTVQENMDNNPKRFEKAIKHGLTDLDICYEAIAGSVGAGVAQKFRTYIKVYTEIPKWDDIITGRVKECPEKLVRTRPDAMYALSTLIASRTSSMLNKVDLKNIDIKNKANRDLTTIGKFIKTIGAEEHRTNICKRLFQACSYSLVDFITDNAEFNEMMVDVADAYARTDEW